MTTATFRVLQGSALVIESGIRRASQFEAGCFILKPGNVANRRAPERPGIAVRADGPVACIGDIAINLDFRPGCAVAISEDFDGSQPTKGVVLVRLSGTDVLDADYLRAWILSGEIERQLQPRHKGSTMTYVKLNDLLDVVVPIPSLTVQRELTRRLVAATEEFRIASRYAEQAAEVLELESKYLVARSAEAARSTAR